MPVAIYDLTFERHNINDYNNHISLKEISPILLAESYAEYKKLADHTDGFDPSWKR